MNNTKTYVASVAMHSAMGDPTTNLDRIAEWSSKAREQGAAFALFPEECITGSMNKSDIPPEESMRIAQAAAEQSVPFLESLCRELDMTLVVGTIEPAGERYRNSAYIVGPGGYLATFTKLHIPNETERALVRTGEPAPRRDIARLDLRRGDLLRPEVSGDLPHRRTAGRGLFPPRRGGQRLC